MEPDVPPSPLTPIPLPSDGRGQADGTQKPVEALPSGLDYEVVRLIGRGGYGEVWLVREAAGGYRACKVIYRASFDHQRPYEREYEGIRKFEPVSQTNESQVHILHVGRRDEAGYFYYIMELADDAQRGRDIAPEAYVPKTLNTELTQRGRLPINECIHLGLSLSATLEHLHRNGLIHRDIKPANIIFVNGIPKLADIGLVTEADVSVSYVGTEGYIAPEGPRSAQADIYGLGKVLYEMSTGFDRANYPELPADLGELPDRLARLEFNAVVTRACEPDVRKRYRSARQLHGDLAVLQGGGSVRLRRAIRLRWVWAGRLALLLLAFLGCRLAILNWTSTPEPASPASPPTKAVAKIPAPDPGLVTASETQLLADMKGLAGGSPQARLRAARELLAQSETTGNPAREFASLRLAAKLAAEAEEFTLAMEACAKMAERFQVEALPAKLELLSKSGLRAQSPGANAGLAEACIATGFEAIAADDYEHATAMVGLAQSAAALSQTPQINGEVEFFAKENARCKSDYERARQFVETLREKPGDPAASLGLGQFLCFVKNDWETGLPLMAHGNDASLKEVLEREISPKSDRPRDQIATGDLWWNLAGAAPGELKAAYQIRARYWYLLGVAHARGPEKTRLRDELAGKIKAVPSPSAQLRISSRVNGTQHIAIYADELRCSSTRGAFDTRINQVFLGDFKAGGLKVIRNCGATRLFSEAVDFSTAQLTIVHKGRRRGRASLDVAEDHVRVVFAEPVLGLSDWEVIVTFGTLPAGP